MKKLMAVCLVVVLISITSPVMATITIDFDALSGSYLSYTISDVTFSAVGGGDIDFGLITPNGTAGIINLDIPILQELRADITGGASYVSVDLGDYDVDNDLLFLEVFDSIDTSLGYTDLLIDAQFEGMETLSLFAPNIAYAVFGARDALMGSSVFADNFTFKVTVIPAPGAILLGGIGVSLVGWLRRRRTL